MQSPSLYKFFSKLPLEIKAIVVKYLMGVAIYNSKHIISEWEGYKCP